MNKSTLISMSLISFSLNAQDFTKQWEYLESTSEESIPIELLDIWDYFYQNPININNTKEIEQLNTLYLLTEDEFKLISNFCKTNKLISIYQLQILEIDTESLKRIRNFIRVPQTHIKSTKTHSDFFMGIQCISPQRIGIKNKEYQGSPMKTHYRYRTVLKSGWRLGLNLEKDYGEPFLYPNKNLNNLALSIQYKGKRKLKSLIIGKYDITLGEGLLFGTSYRRNNPYFVSYSASDITRSSLSPKEYNYFEGIAAEWKNKDFSINLFASNKKLHGTSRPDKTGLFRTSSEITKRNAAKEKLYGVTFSLENNQHKVCIANIRYQSEFENREPNYFQSVYYSKTYYNFVYSTEMVIQNFKHSAAIHKLTLSSSNKSLISVQFRSRIASLFNQYRSDYTHFSNGYENGFLWCFQHNFNKKWQFRANFDHFKANFKKNEFYKGRAIYTNISKNTDKRKIGIQLQYKIYSNTQKTTKLRLFFQEYLSSNTRVNLKGNYTWESGNLNSSLQTNLYQTSSNKKHKITISYCLFNTPGSSIFWQGPYFYGSSNSKFVFGKGIITSLSFQTKRRKTKLGIQMNYLRYSDREGIGTGNERSNRPYKLELSLYLKWKT